MGKRSRTAGETFSAEELSLSELDAQIATLEWRHRSKINSALRKAAFKKLVWLEKERERIYAVPAPLRRIPRQRSTKQ